MEVYDDIKDNLLMILTMMMMLMMMMMMVMMMMMQLMIYLSKGGKYSPSVGQIHPTLLTDDDNFS